MKDYFDKFSYAGAEFHKKEHTSFSEQVREFQIAFMENKQNDSKNSENLTADLWKLLQSWLVNHINNSDREYKPLFTNSGVE